MCPPYIVDGRAGASVLAVQSVPVEEHEVSDEDALCRLIDAKESFHRRPVPTLGLWIEDANPHDTWGLHHLQPLRFRDRADLSLGTLC